jgi:hypothetical protein
VQSTRFENNQSTSSERQFKPVKHGNDESIKILNILIIAKAQADLVCIGLGKYNLGDKQGVECLHHQWQH